MPEEVNITGWDFSGLTETGRMKETPLPWDYRAIVKQYMQGISAMLDMGTGGGGFLMTLQPFPENTFVTEGYEPNVRIAEENLKSLGVKVVSGYKDDALPFKNDLFDLVINRHEYYDPKEVYRILKPGGFFITQQVKGNCDDTIIELFGSQAVIDFTDWCIDKAINELKKNNFEIIQHDEAEGFTEFTDTGALVSYLKVINWIVPDFTSEKYSQEVNQASKIIANNGSFKSTLDRFLVIGKKLS